MKSHAALAVLCLSILSAVLPETGRAADRLILGACTDPALPKGARCGTYKVFENRAAKKGRRISLRVVVLPALGPDRLPDPVVSFAGGPGESSVGEAGYLSRLLAPLRQRRDILLVDARGTGGSSPLDCPELQDVQGFLDDNVPAGKVRACRERLRKTADLSQYTTDNTVDDVDEVRAALGYPQVNITGASYGTRSVLVYLRRHPGPGAHRGSGQRGADPRPVAAVLRAQHAEGAGRPGGGVRGGRGLRPGISPSSGRDRRGARASRAGAGPRAAHRPQDRQAV